MSENKKTLNNSVAKAFTLLECFTPAKQEWGVRELAQQLQANKSTTYRLMATLESLGVLRKDQQTEKYSLGLKLFELGNKVDVQHSLVSHTHPELLKVASEIAETVHLGILNDHQVLMVDKVESPKGLKLNSVIGMYSPAYCTGIGKVLLSHLSAAELKTFLTTSDLVSKTEFTIVQPKKLQEALIQIKAQGFAIDRQEMELGLICVAVPVFNQNGIVVAALSAAGPSIRFREEALMEYVAILQKGATAIQKRIGGFVP